MMQNIQIVKILQKEPFTDKILKNKAFDGYQRGLASMVYKFFDKKICRKWGKTR